MSPEVAMKQIEPTIDKLKHMNIDDVERIFATVNNNYYFEYEMEPEYEGRQTMMVTKPIQQGFYKSSGPSRGTGLVGIWLPYSSVELGRIAKPEDRFIAVWDKLWDKRTIFDGQQKSDVIDIIRNPLLVLYARFINYDNASISATMAAHGL